MTSCAKKHSHLVLRFFDRVRADCRDPYPDRAARTVDILISRDRHDDEVVSRITKYRSDFLSHPYDSEGETLDFNLFIQRIDAWKELVSDAEPDETSVAGVLFFS